MDNTQETTNTAAVADVDPLVSAYVTVLAQPYVDALTAATTIESVVEWLPAVVPERANEIVAVLAELPNVEVAKSAAVSWLQNLLLEYAEEKEAVTVDELTPWDLAVHRDEMLTRLFGPATTELPITVVVGPNGYAHNMTEELAYGLVVGLQGHPEIGLFFNNVPLTPDNFDLKNKEIPGKYRVMVDNKEYHFNTPDFIQGIKTAAEWTGRKAQEVATNLTDMKDVTAMTFN